MPGSTMDSVAVNRGPEKAGESRAAKRRRKKQQRQQQQQQQHEQEQGHPAEPEMEKESEEIKRPNTAEKSGSSKKRRVSGHSEAGARDADSQLQLDNKNEGKMCNNAHKSEREAQQGSTSTRPSSTGSAFSCSHSPSTTEARVSEYISNEADVFDLVDDDLTEDGLSILTQAGLDHAMKARMFFQWLIAPLSIEEFYEKYYEKKPFHIRRNNENYYNDWFTLAEMRRILAEHPLEYGKDLDLTMYKDNVRSTLNPDGLVDKSLVEKEYFRKKKCSVRLLRPQAYCDTLWLMLSTLEEEWGSMAGANTYWTPAGSQGFAPHYDDVEAFVLQAEGEKHWTLYAPPEEEALPRFSSPNFKPEELPAPIYKAIVKKGDLLYFPRGYIHQARSTEKHDSLHVTVSCGQQNSWGDLLELMIPQAMAYTFKKNITLRKSLPRDYLSYMGAMFSDEDNNKRKTFLNTLKGHLQEIMNEVEEMVDSAADQRAIKFLTERLPPMLDEEEEDYSAEGSPLPKITVDSSIRILRRNIARLAIEEGKAVLYHLMENDRAAAANCISPLEFELDDAPALEIILRSYPQYTRVGDLPLPTNDDQLDMVNSLYKEGILMLECEGEKE